MQLDAQLRQQYEQLFESCVVAPAHRAAVAATDAQLKSHQPRYQSVGGPLGIPWYVVGVIHAMETGIDFTRHLHNGDPLTARTVHVPAGRPPTGEPPFTWEESATDALTYQGFAAWHDWSVPGILYKLEAYNGFGYRQHPECGFTPYLWSFSNHYTRGKYVGDGVWSATTVSQQCGAAVLLEGLIPKPKPAERALQLTTPHMHGADVVSAQKLLAHNPYGAFLSGGVDGDYGDLTAAAVKRAKWDLGYPTDQCDGDFGPLIRAFLSGKEKLPPDYAARRNQRV
jgi:lysozyme family protein